MEILFTVTDYRALSLSLKLRAMRINCYQKPTYRRLLQITVLQICRSMYFPQCPLTKNVKIESETELVTAMLSSAKMGIGPESFKTHRHSHSFLGLGVKQLLTGILSFPF